MSGIVFRFSKIFKKITQISLYLLIYKSSRFILDSSAKNEFIERINIVDIKNDKKNILILKLFVNKIKYVADSRRIWFRFNK